MNKRPVILVPADPFYGWKRIEAWRRLDHVGKLSDGRNRPSFPTASLLNQPFWLRVDRSR